MEDFIKDIADVKMVEMEMRAALRGVKGILKDMNDHLRNKKQILLLDEAYYSLNEDVFSFLMLCTLHCRESGKKKNTYMHATPEESFLDLRAYANDKDFIVDKYAKDMQLLFY